MYSREIEFSSGEYGTTFWVGVDGVSHPVLLAPTGKEGRRVTLVINRKTYPSDIHVGDKFRVPIDTQKPGSSSGEFRVVKVTAREQTLGLIVDTNETDNAGIRFWRVSIEGEEIAGGSPSGKFLTTRRKRWALPGQKHEDVQGFTVFVTPDNAPKKKWALSLSFYKDSEDLDYYPGDEFEEGLVTSCSADRVDVRGETIWRISMEVEGEDK